MYTAIIEIYTKLQGVKLGNWLMLSWQLDFIPKSE